MTDTDEKNTAETVFTYGAPQLKFGRGASDEIGYDLAGLGVRRVLVVTDAGLAATGLPKRIIRSLATYDITAVLFDDVRVEPTDASLRTAIEFARSHGPFDAFIAVGGGSSIDTAKAVNLLLTNPGDLLDYVNAPVGGGRQPTVATKPLVAVPTTTGTGAESTTICVLDVLDQRVKTGISHARLRPTMAVVDPALTMTQPPLVTASAGMDILCHALESWTARPYTDYPKKRADERVPYCGANPISDMWSAKGMELLAGAFRQAVRDGAQEEARDAMAMAATFAGLGFGNAGVHIPHANAYPIAGQVKDYRPQDYPDDHAMVPHGMAVAMTAPAAFEHTFATNPERHLQAARWLDPTASGQDATTLPTVVRSLMRDIGMPNGLAELGFTRADVDDLVAGTMKQQRLLAAAPCPVTESDVAHIFAASFQLW